MQTVVSVSGGKDSTACYLLAILRDKPFRAVTADTGHENAQTYDYIRELAHKTGGPEIEVVKANFSAQISHKRELVQTKWIAEGIADKIIQAALEVLHPTGNPFLDLCIWKGRFPSRMAQFCTEYLKARPIFEQVFEPILAVEPLISWQGERKAESLNRARYKRLQRINMIGMHDRFVFRPILHWSAENAFEMHKIFGVPWNPLYEQNAHRVGCWPCINSSKAELASIFKRYPEVVQALRRWELIVSKASKRGEATFFASSATPQGKQLAKDQREGKRSAERMPTVMDVAEWTKTSRGGQQYDAFFLMDDAGPACASQYGLCE